MAMRVRRWSDVDARRHHLPGLGRATSDETKASHAHAVHHAGGHHHAATAVPAAAASSNVVTLAMMDVHHQVAEEVQECVICLDELEFGKALFTAECGHRFHFSCLLENVNHDEANSDKCPICRKSQTQWPEQTEGLVKAHPYCTNCGKRGTGGQFCDGCGNSLAHTPTAQERARAAAAAAAARSNVVVECPSCRIRCLVSTTARGTLQCPNGHLFQLRVPPPMGNSQLGGMGMRQSFSGSSSGGAGGGGSRLIMRQCPTCYTRVQMPPGSQPGQYMCPHGHTFYFTPFQ
uniref:RING-type domain-containing protein n=1 Tax=Globisporangium ultimum (strain ATCC 200006 / CBS 805.95 / DAOM BR144) TaxID=431595 RepID=K3W5T2_GLOUD